MPILAHSHWRYQSQMMSDCFLLIHPPHPRPSAKLRGQHSLTQGCNPESHLLRKISSKETGCAGEMPWDSTRISNFKSPAQCVFNFLNASLNLFLMWMVVQRTIPTSSKISSTHHVHPRITEAYSNPAVRQSNHAGKKQWSWLIIWDMNQNHRKPKPSSFLGAENFPKF